MKLLTLVHGQPVFLLASSSLKSHGNEVNGTGCQSCHAAAMQANTTWTLDVARSRWALLRMNSLDLVKLQGLVRQQCEERWEAQLRASA